MVHDPVKSAKPPSPVQMGGGLLLGNLSFGGKPTFALAN